MIRSIAIAAESVDSNRWPITLSSLLVRPIQIPDEHQRGYWLRLAHSNGLAVPGWMRKIAGFSKPDFAFARWCSLCLGAEGAYWKQTWGNGIPLCPLHQCWLSDQCEGCGRSLTWRSTRFSSCGCGYDLTKTSTIPLSSHTASLFQLEEAAGQPADWWRTLTAERKWKVAVFLGALFQFGLYGKPFKKASISELAVERKIVEAGAEIMKGGETAFHQLLNRIRVCPSGSSTVQTMREAFPTLLIRMKKLLRPYEYESLISQVRSYRASNADSSVPILWRGESNQTVMSGTECARFLGVRPTRIKELLVSHGLTPKIRQTASGRSRLAIGLGTIEQIRRSSVRAISAKAVAKAFGLSPVRQAALIRAELIAKIGNKVDARSVHMLLDSLASCHLASDMHQPLDFVRLDLALRTLVPGRFTVQFFRAILASKVVIRKLSDDCVHTGALEISRSDTIALLEKVREPSGRFMTIPQAAAYMHLKEEVVYHLVNNSLIKTTVRKEGRRHARFVNERELLRFANRYVSLVCAAERAGICRQGALKWAQSCGMKIVSGPCVDNGRQYFVEKSDAAGDIKTTIAP